MYVGVHLKCLLYVSNFNRISIFSTFFSNINCIIKFHSHLVAHSLTCFMWMNRNNEANSSFFLRDGTVHAITELHWGVGFKVFMVVEIYIVMTMSGTSLSMFWGKHYHHLHSRKSGTWVTTHRHKMSWWRLQK